jgi:trimeric autotransporter adhesin
MTDERCFPIIAVLALTLFTSTMAAQPGIINTFAGGGNALRNNMPPKQASICRPTTSAADSHGNIYIPSYCLHVVFRLDHTTGLLSIVAENLLFPMGVTLDKADNLYIIDGARIWRVDAGTQNITVIAYDLAGAYGIAIDGAGNLFFAEGFANRIRKLDVVTSTISTLAGNGSQGFCGDNGPALEACLNFPLGIAVDQFGNVFFSDSNNNRVRRVDATTGVITTVAGGGSGCNGQTDIVGDACAATAAILKTPFGVAIDSLGNLLIGDGGNNRIRRVDKASGVISTVAGNGKPGYSGNGGPATKAKLFNPVGIALDRAGNLLIGDSGNNRVRRVGVATGIIKDVAGNGGINFVSDNVPAIGAALAPPSGVAVDDSGNVFLFDSGNNRIRRVDRASGLITTVAGNGTGGYSGDGKLATAAQIYAGDNSPNGIGVDKAGNLFIADTGNHRVRRVDVITHVITTVAGNGISGFSGDGGPATRAQLDSPRDVKVDKAGNLLIVDGFMNARVRRVDALNHVITTVAGGGNGCPEQTGPELGDGCVATDAALREPFSVALNDAGDMFITQQLRIRRVDAITKIITSVAGNGEWGFSGEGGPAMDAKLTYPFGIVFDGLGNSFVADTYNNRVRRINSWNQLIRTIAGGGDGCANQTDDLGDGCRAVQGSMLYINALALDNTRHLFIADTGNARIREMTLPKLPTSTTLVSSKNPSHVGESVTFTVTVTWQGGSPPDGEPIKFSSGTTIYGTVALKAGSASLAISNLPVGTPTVKATYGGDTNLQQSRGTLLQEVDN